MTISFGRGYGVSNGPHLSRKRRNAAVGVPESPDINAGMECRSFCLKTEGSAAAAKNKHYSWMVGCRVMQAEKAAVLQVASVSIGAPTCRRQIENPSAGPAPRRSSCLHPLQLRSDHLPLPPVTVHPCGQQNSMKALVVIFTSLNRDQSASSTREAQPWIPLR